MAAFRAGTDDNRGKILAKAIELELVPDATPTESFLGMFAAKEGDKEATLSLEKLNEFVMLL